jgi:hypothetical protein
MYRAKPIYNKLISNFKIKISLPVRAEVSKEDKILKNLSLNQTKSVFLQSSNKIRNSQSENFVITLSSFFSMLRKEFKNNSSVEHSYKHPISIKPRTLTQFGRKIYLKTSASAIPFYLIVRNKGIEKNKIKKLKFKLFNNKKVRSNFQSHSPRFRYHSQNSLKGGLFKPEIKGTAKEETGVEGIISKDNNYYNFDKHIKKVEKGSYENHKTTTFKKSIGNNFISSGKGNKVKNYKFQFNNYAKNRKIRSKIAKFKLIEPFQARNFVDFIKDKNKKLIIKEMFKSLNNIKNEINLIDLKKKEEKLKIKIDRLIAKARKKIIIFTIIELFKKINFFKFTKKEKLIYPANTFYIFYFKKEFELMLSNFFKAGVSISEFNLPDKAYIDINSNYKKDNSQPIKEINLKKIVNTKGSTAISNILNSKRVDGEVNTINTIKGLEIDSKKRLRIFNILNLPYLSLPKSLMKKSLRRKQLLRKNLKKKLIFTKIKKLIRNPKKNQTLIPLLTNTKKAAPLVKRVVKNINQVEKSYGDKKKNYKILSRELGGKKKKKFKKKNVVLIRYNKIKKNQNITPFGLGKVKIFKPSVYIYLAKPFYSQHLKVKELGLNKKGKIKKEGKKAVKIKQQTRSPKLNITNKVSVKVQKKIKINEKSKDISNVVMDKEERLQSSYLAYLFKKSKHYYSKKSNLNVNIDIVENKFIFSYKYININQLLVKSIKKKIDINKPTFKDNLINNKEIDSSLGENINSIETTLNVKKEVLNKVNNKKIIKSYAQSSAHAPEGEGLKLKNKAPFNIKGGRGVLLKGKDNKTKPFSQGLGRKKKNKYKLKKQKSLGAWLKKIANLKKKKQYVKDLNNYKFVIMKRNKKKEQLFRKLYSLKKRIRLKKIIIPVNTNRIKNKFNKNYMLRKFPTPILGRREEINLLNNSAKENKINMVK